MFLAFMDVRKSVESKGQFWGFMSEYYQSETVKDVQKEDLHK
jgi:hypothetical protein